MKVYYLNDEQAPVRVRIMDERYDCITGKGDFFYELKACEGATFDVQLPPNTCLYVKKWKGLVMLSWMQESGLEHLGRVLPELQHLEQPREES